MAEAIGYFHESDLTHRDLKPKNVMIVPGESNPPGPVVIMDFGLVRKMDGTALTQTGALLGTPLYVPPEQAVGGKMDKRSDIFQAGLICYEMLTGNRPFMADSLQELVALCI